jgi:hypothetical protein
METNQDHEADKQWFLLVVLLFAIIAALLVWFL